MLYRPTLRIASGGQMVDRSAEVRAGGRLVFISHRGRPEDHVSGEKLLQNGRAPGTEAGFIDVTVFLPDSLLIGVEFGLGPTEDRQVDVNDDLRVTRCGWAGVFGGEDQRGQVTDHARIDSDIAHRVGSLVSGLLLVVMSLRV